MAHSDTKRKKGERVVTAHPLPPLVWADSRVLILGTMPSPASRAAGFYYGHPRNRFWMVLPSVYSEGQPENNQDKISFLRRHRLALWDVLASCEIRGAGDSSIRNPIPNDLAGVLQEREIRALAFTGAAAFRLYKRFFMRPAANLTLPENIALIPLPSTSPANAKMNLSTLVESYSALRAYTDF